MHFIIDIVVGVIVMAPTALFLYTKLKTEKAVQKSYLDGFELGLEIKNEAGEFINQIREKENIEG